LLELKRKNTPTSTVVLHPVDDPKLEISNVILYPGTLLPRGTTSTSYNTYSVPPYSLSAE